MFDGIGFLEQGTLQLIYSAAKCWLEHNPGNSCYHTNMTDLKNQVETQYNLCERREEAKRYQAFMAQKGTV